MELTTSWQLVSQAPMSLKNTYLRVYAKYNSQSVSGNYSSVSIEERIYCANASFHCYTHSCNFTGGTFGDSDYQGSYYHGWESNTETTILSQTKNVTHNTDGTKSFNIGAYFTCSAGVSGTVPDTSVSLPKINRVSIFSISKPTFIVGDVLVATITSYVSSYHQDLYMTIGNNDVLIQSSATGTFDIETNLLANQIYQAIPNAKETTNVFKLYTYDSNQTFIGSYQITYRAIISNSDPTFNIAYQDTNATTTAITSDNQQIIQNNSTLQFNFTDATALHYANLSTYAITINGETRTGSISSSTLNVTWGTLNLSANTNASVSITDSRGFTTTKTVALEVLGWDNPTAIITLNRKQNYYTETDIKVDATYSSLDSKNTITIQYRIKKTSDNNWGGWNNLTDNTLVTFNADNQYSWDVQIKVQDSIGTTTYNVVLPIGMAIFFIDRLKRSLGVNCFPKRIETLEINGNDISNTYSTTDEIPIGTWINGETIYKKTIYISSLPNNSTDNYYLADYNIDPNLIIEIEGFCHNVSGTTALNWQKIGGVRFDAGTDVAYWVDYTSNDGYFLRIQTGNDKTGFEAYVTFKYTKSV